MQPLLQELQAFMRDHVYPAGKSTTRQRAAFPCSILLTAGLERPALAAFLLLRLPPCISPLLACLPAEAALNAHAMSDARWSVHPVQEWLKEEARRQGLWNLWLPAGA